MYQGSKCLTSGPHYGSECWRRGCVPRWVQTPRSAPGFKHRCPSHRLDPEFGAQLQTIQSGPQFGTRRRNPSARRRTVHSDEPSDADAGTRIQRGTGTILRNSVRHMWVRMRAAGDVVCAQHSECGAQSQRTRGLGGAVGLPLSGFELRCRGLNADSECWN